MVNKSGLRILSPSEILFNDGDTASSLYIIQKGQLRLFKPKGKGYVEIAILRAGEVIGEMAYFDEENGRKRSCSAEAMIQSEVIEIGFTAFSKTMENLNPWFKTIINTLAQRLRATNTKVKELESNSTSVNYTTGKHSGYEFLKTNDVLKILATLFLVFKTHGEDASGGSTKISRNTMRLYFQDVYGLSDVKYEALLFVLEKIELLMDVTSEVIFVKDLAKLRQLFIFFQTEKHLAEDKRLKISLKEETILHEVLFLANEIGDEGAERVIIQVDGLVGADSLLDSRTHDLVGPVVVEKDETKSMSVNRKKLRKLLPIVRFLNEIEKINREKA